MIFGTDRNELRQMYVDAWRKSCAGEILSPLEAQIAQVIQDHPEYQPAMSTDTLDESFLPEGGETNPFLACILRCGRPTRSCTWACILRCGSRLRPTGRQESRKYLNCCARKAGTGMRLNTKALDCLAEALWTAQNNNTAPDEQAYLESLRRLASLTGIARWERANKGLQLAPMSLRGAQRTPSTIHSPGANVSLDARSAPEGPAIVRSVAGQPTSMRSLHACNRLLRFARSQRQFFFARPSGRDCFRCNIVRRNLV